MHPNPSPCAVSALVPCRLVSLPLCLSQCSRMGTTTPALGFAASCPPIVPTLAEQLQVPDLLAHLELQDLLQDLLALRLGSDAHALQLLPIQPQQRPTCQRHRSAPHIQDTAPVVAMGTHLHVGIMSRERETILKRSFTTRDGEALQVAPGLECSGCPAPGQACAPATTSPIPAGRSFPFLRSTSRIRRCFSKRVS